ncbi:MAG: HD-GYP domain-containing protein [Candidatus Methylomirabilales bacterium]
MGALGGEPPRSEEPPAQPEAGDRPEALYYQAAQQEVGRVLAAAKAGTGVAVGALQRIAAGLARAVTGGDDLLLQAMENDGPKMDLPRHMVNVAVFAVKIGQGSGCREEELPWLALAACLHDVGMLAVPHGLLDKPAALTAEEMALVRRHPEVGFRLLQPLGPEFEWVANVALQEHEREDGTGYPKGLRGEAIHDYAKIVGLADVYEAMTHTRAYRPTRVASAVVKELIGAERRRFPDRILKGLIRGLSTAPVGSLVRLNSNEVGRVVATNPAFPLRPVVEVITGAKGERLDEPRRVDLSTNTLLYITDASATRTRI